MSPRCSSIAPSASATISASALRSSAARMRWRCSRSGPDREPSELAIGLQRDAVVDLRAEQQAGEVQPVRRLDRKVPEPQSRIAFRHEARGKAARALLLALHIRPEALLVGGEGA